MCVWVCVFSGLCIINTHFIWCVYVCVCLCVCGVRETEWGVSFRALCLIKQYVSGEKRLMQISINKDKHMHSSIGPAAAIVTSSHRHNDGVRVVRVMELSGLWVKKSCSGNKVVCVYVGGGDVKQWKWKKKGIIARERENLQSTSHYWLSID